MSTVPPGGPTPPPLPVPPTPPGITPGSVVVDRYRLEQPATSDLAGAAVWLARDTILDRPVRLTFLDAGATAALDAARRAALVADPRLSRVLDVGSTRLGAERVGYVVNEPFSGSTLTQIVSSGLVDAQQARAIIGEAAAALDVAAQRGVHHLALRPDAVRVDGSRVLVTGLGLDAGLAGVDGAGGAASSAVSAATDARELAALAYYALTARWAGDSLDEPWVAADAVRPLPAQLDDQGFPVSLTSLVPHVDPALSAVVDRTLAGADGAPQTPGELADALRPWGEVSVVAALPGFVQPAGGTPVRQSVRSTGATPGAPVRRPTGRIVRSTGAAAAGAVAGAVGATPPPSPSAPAPRTPSATPPPWDPGTATQMYAPQSAPQDYGPPAGYGQPGAPAPGYAPQGQPTQYAAQPQPGAAFATEAAPRPRRGVNPTPIVLGILLVAVIAAAGWAVMRAFQPFGGDAGTQVAVSPTGDTATPAPDDTAGDDATTDTPETAPEVRPVIDTAIQVLPAAECRGEQPEQAPLAVDGDPSTFWFTCTYNDANFGGLKDGLGLAVTLREPAPVTSVTLLTNSEGGHVQVRKTTVDSPTEGPVLAEGPISPTTELTFAQPEVGESFVIWVTELPQSAGASRLELTEIMLQ